MWGGSKDTCPGKIVGYVETGSSAEYTRIYMHMLCSQGTRIVSHRLIQLNLTPNHILFSFYSTYSVASLL